MIINYSNQSIKKGEKSIFLAGPTPRTKSIISWRKEALEILEKLNFDGIVYIPELECKKDDYDYITQLDFETEALKCASIIVFWIPRKLPYMPAFSTNVEFGEWYKYEKCIYGRPDNSPKNKYLDKKYFKETNRLPFSSLVNMLIYAVDVLNNGYYKNSNELDLIRRMLKKFPELELYLKKVAKPKHEQPSGTIGELLYPNFSKKSLKKFNHISLSIILYFYVKNNNYEEFSKCQTNFLKKISKESFIKLREFLFSIVNTNEKEDLLLYYLSIIDICRNKDVFEMLNKYGLFKLSPNISVNYLLALDCLPSFKKLTQVNRYHLMMILQYKIDINSFIKCEYVDYSLKSLSKLDNFEISIMILQEIFSLAGKCGFFKESGTNSLDEHKLENLFILKDILINKDTEDWDKTIFSNFLNKEIEAYRLYNNDDKKRIAIMKLLLMLNLNDLEYANSLNKKINFKYSILIHELNITGYDNQKAIVLCHASELLLFVVNYFIKKLSDYNLVLLDTLDICLPFFQNIMIYIREKFKSNESNGVIEVNLSNMIDIASNNPYRLNEFDLSSIKYEVIE